MFNSGAEVFSWHPSAQFLGFIFVGYLRNAGNSLKILSAQGQEKLRKFQY